LLQNEFGKHAMAAKFDPFVQQLEQHVLACLADGG
jgi:hypothetical protein